MLISVISNAQDTTFHILDDSLLVNKDTIVNDTSFRSRQRSGKALSSLVEYSSFDSIRFDVQVQKVYMFGNAEINYDKINLKAAYIEIDFTKSELFAEGLPDSTGEVVGTPVFEEGGKSFNSKQMFYNFDTKKGLIKYVITQEGEGYIHGSIIKKMSDDIIYIKGGKYTTCSHEHPHFEFRFDKSKVIPDDKIITGPAYLVIEGVPTPLAIPFGLFPNKKGQTSGILIPTWGNSANRGYFFENGGYYWVINDYLDLELRGDIYTRGSWAIKTGSRYKKRYKYSGGVNMNYAKNIIGEENSTDFSKSTDFSFRWAHKQDPKARPNSRFNSNVNIVSNNYNKYNPSNTNSYLSNTFQSSVSYSTNWENKYFLTANLNHSQNTLNRTISLILPELSFSVNRFYPLRKKERVGKLKWYENMSVDYRMNMKNQLETYDSLLFEPGTLEKFRNGMKHSVSMSVPLKILKFLNMTNSINYTDRWYAQTYEKRWTNDTLFSGNDTIVGYVKTDTIFGFQTARDFSFSSSVTTRVYGILQFKKGPVRAIRHVLSPRIGFSYRPDFGTQQWGYYKYYVDGNSNIHKYSRFNGTVFGGPPDGKSGRITFGVSNNLEMKVRSGKDTITGMKKVVLIEDFTISSSYDLAKDSLNLAPFTMSGRTTLFDKLKIQYSSSWDPYIIDENGRNLNKFEWTENQRLLRFKNSTLNFSLSYRFSYRDFMKERGSEMGAGDERESDKGTQEELEEINAFPEDYVDFDNPWSMNFSYSLRHATTYNPQTTNNDQTTVQTLSFSGDINITPKWKFAFRSGYDFENNEFSYTSIDIYRDLHCWEMRFGWIPTGLRKSWNFTINVKSTLLQDLKLSKKKDFRDLY
ncbi:MAG: LPS-assembly protein LptD [Bacteroidales bacterium]|nr:LPS-assembly protein LptD [Bacteroidales bacterium]